MSRLFSERRWRRSACEHLVEEQGALGFGCLQLGHDRLELCLEGRLERRVGLHQRNEDEGGAVEQSQRGNVGLKLGQEPLTKRCMQSTRPMR